MNTFSSRLTTILAVVIVTVGLDQWTKKLAVDHLQNADDQLVLGEFFRLTFAKNRGAFLSLGSELDEGMRNILLNLVPAVLLIVLFVYLLREKRINRWQVIGLAAIVGGGLSNIIDRILFGYVVDFMHMKVGNLQTGIFNIADVAIMIGMGIMLRYAFQKQPEEEVPEHS
ncbi:signal peptidase II [Lewinellaceae bacterium SD302]|nr:signal peptidase II [Lewinellaceae bacterium SD302]